MRRVSYETARAALSRRVGPESLAHCERVAETAARLAEAYGLDVEDARVAGLLHDWARDDAPERLLRSAEQAGIEIADVDRARPYLLHARVGAAELRDALPELPAAIVAAVERHTMGASTMEDLDRVVYIADMIEPDRRFAAADDLRLAVGAVSLQELFLRAYSVSLIHLVNARRRIHPLTVETWNARIAEVGE